jgi:glycosyltransferase involved in cell wall biosynthesis
MTHTPIIAYVSQQFPNLTATFTYREVLALRRRGLVVRPISTWRPQSRVISAEARGLIEETFYIFPLQWPKLLSLHLRYLFTRSRRYLSTLALLVFFNREPFRNRLRLLAHFIYAVSATAEVERCEAQHIHADYALNAATVALVASRLSGRSFSFTAHAADIFVNPILLREKIVAAWFGVAISEYNKRYLINAAGNASVASKLHVVHCGLDLDQFALRPAQALNPRPVLLSVGRLVEKKGLRYLVEACHILAERGRDFECLIVGEGPEEAALRRLVVERDLANRVRLLGALPQERVRELLGQVDTFALPCVMASNNDQDGIPVVLMEAMASGVPVISTRISGNAELIQDGVNGLLVPPGNAGALAKAIAYVWDNPLLAEQLAGDGRSTIERDFHIDKNIEQLAQLFQSCLQNQAATTSSAGSTNPLGLAHGRNSQDNEART